METENKRKQKSKTRKNALRESEMLIPVQSSFSTDICKSGYLFIFSQNPKE